ncbi:proline and serine-rich protein 2-like isoform X5 [Arapaima gigas]
MDRLRVPAGSRARSGLNGRAQGAQGDARNHSGSFEDDLLQFLTCEERESILFLEHTINSLELELEDEDLPLESSSPVASRLSYARLSSVPELPSSLQEQDIIDLVETEPDTAGHGGILFDLIVPDFRNMVVSPETHFELKPKWEPAENIPSTYSVPQPLTPSSAPDDHIDSSSQSLHQPAGSIPTPVIIAQKIAAYQAGGQSIHPSSCRRSLESAGGSSSPSLENPVKDGPSVSAKPIRYPDNISIHTGSRDFGQTINRASVNVLQRQAQVLANLPGTSHTVESLETRIERKIPTRSMSFRDPAPDKSHMEALSKLGLTRDRSMSSSYNQLLQVKTPPLPTTKAPFSSTNNSDNKPLSCNSETSSVDLNIYSGKSSSSRSTASSEPKAGISFQYMDSYDRDNTVTPQMAPSCAVGDVNNYYRGRTKIITPLSTARNEVTSNNHDSIASVIIPPLSTKAANAEVSPGDNTGDQNGGQTKTKSPILISMLDMTTPSSLIVSKNSRPTETIPSSLSTGAEAFSVYNSHGENSRVTASSAINSNTSRPSAIGLNARSMSFSKDSETLQLTRQSRTSSFHGVPTCSEPWRRSFTKPPTVRPQGITVQFSGRGASDESRREALRKLGLLRDSS